MDVFSGLHGRIHGVPLQLSQGVQFSVSTPPNLLRQISLTHLARLSRNRISPRTAYIPLPDNTKRSQHHRQQGI